MRRSLIVLALSLLAAESAAAIGLLVPTDPGAEPVRLVSHRVDVKITERGATTRVTQEFQNDTGRPLEATYLFPLPKGASVDEFALWMNGKRETGKVLERGEARRIYESIVQRTRDPGLIEYVDAQLFEARVFPVPPSGRQKVELIYTHLVPYEGGVHRYVYPMKTDQRAARTLEDFTLNVAIKSKLPVRNLYSPSHRVATRTTGTTGQASFEASAFSLQDDFTLYWSVDDKDVGLTLLSYKPSEDEAGYFMLLASPKDGVRESEIIGKRLTLVVDTSGSMAGEKMDAVKGALDYILSRLGGDDLFNVVTFGGYAEAFSERMLSASPQNVQRARKFVEQIEPLGGTNIEEAMELALKGATGSKRAPHMIVFLTDGRPTVGESDTKKLLAKVKADNGDAARVFVFGVGDDVNTLLLDKLAQEHGGTSSYLEGNAKAEEELKAFYDRVSHPVLSGLRLAVDGPRLFGEHPRALPDLFKGGQLVLLGRYAKGGKATVTLTGRSARGEQTFRYDAALKERGGENAFIARLWAQRQVAMLLEEVREQGERPGLVSEITQLATAFGIVTPYTSYLVVEPGHGLADGEDRARGGRPAPALAADDFGAFAPSPPAEAEASGGGPGSPAKGAMRSSSGRDLLRQESGEGAVAAAKEISRLKQGTVASERKVKTEVLLALGRTFRFDGTRYVDEGCLATAANGHKAKRAVEPFSPSYFEALRLRPDLAPAFALAEEVTIEVAPGRCLVLMKGGDQKPSAGLETFLRP